uniref:Secreted protein n=1 Tax=Stomoxys calcitrans TaxID=35570 RepID=A0A1I8PIU5_STOCA
MRYLAVIFTVALTIQLALAAPHLNPEQGVITSSKTFQLVKKVSKDLSGTLWSHDIYEKIGEYLNELKNWCNNDDKLKEASIYEKFEKHVDTCLELLKQLNEDPDNCQTQWALRNEHGEIRKLFNKAKEQDLHETWLAMYGKFASSLQVTLKPFFETFFTNLSTDIAGFLKTSPQGANVQLIKWNEKFDNESDYIKKRWMLVSFMDLFPQERDALKVEQKCEIHFCIGM